MKINLTKKQFEALTKVVYLGNWMANAQRTGSDDDPQYKEYEDIADYIYSFAPDFGLPDYYESNIEFSDGDDPPTEASRLHEEYDELNFWEELPYKLGDRDFERKYSEGERKNMTDKEYFTKNTECIIAWEHELEKYGIERLVVDEKIKNHLSELKY